jgi:hypothetical protein
VVAHAGGRHVGWALWIVQGGVGRGQEKSLPARSAPMR